LRGEESQITLFASILIQPKGYEVDELIDSIGCGKSGHAYDVTFRTGILLYPSPRDMDMSAAVRFFTSIDKHVQTIRIFVGGKPTTSYRLLGNGTWEPYDPMFPPHDGRAER
jgi:hypothetical protein